MVEIKKVGANQQLTSTKLNNSSKASSGAPIVGHSGLNKKLEALLSILEIDYETYLKFCQENPTFTAMNVMEQKQIVDASRKSNSPVSVEENGHSSSQNVTESQTTSVETNSSLPNTTSSSTNSYNSQTSILFVGTSDPENISELSLENLGDGQDFDYNRFGALSVEEKRKILDEALVKNRYIYSAHNPAKASDNWDNLTATQRNNYVNNSTRAINETQFYKEMCNQEAYLEAQMQEVQIANANQMTLGEYKNLSEAERDKLKHQYLISIKNQETSEASSDESSMPDSSTDAPKNQMSLKEKIFSCRNKIRNGVQNTYVEMQHNATQGLKDYLAENPDIAEKCMYNGKPLSELRLDENSNLSISELKEIIASINANLPADAQTVQLFDLRENYKEKIQKNTNNEAVDSKKSDGEPSKYRDTGVYKAIKEKAYNHPPKTNFLQSYILENEANRTCWENALTNDVKADLLVDVLQKETDGKSEQEQAQLIADLYKEIVWLGVDVTKEPIDKKELDQLNGELAQIFYNKVLDNASPELITSLSEINSAENMLAFTNSLGKLGKVAGALKNACKNVQELAKNKDTNDVANIAAETMFDQRECLEDEQQIHLAAFTDKNFNHDVQERAVDVGFDLAKRNSEYATSYADAVKENGSYHANSYMANNAFLAGENYENYFLEAGVSSYDGIAQEVIENDVASKFSAQNQADAVHFLRDYVVNNFDEDVQSEYLTTLADNIKNLDASAQQEALSHIYESGDQLAIEKAIENITASQTPQLIQDVELPRTFVEVVKNSGLLESPEFESLDLTAKLSAVQIASLSSFEKQEYYNRIFNQASATDKLKFLEKLPNGTQKKTVFTMIARFSPNMLKTMVDAGMGPQMLSANLPFDASNKVLKTMLSSQDTDVKKQVAELLNNKDYNERIEKMSGVLEKNIVKNEGKDDSHMSLPQDFMSAYNITPEEKQRMQKSMWLLDQAGRFKA